MAKLPRLTPAGVRIAAPMPVPSVGAKAAAQAFGSITSSVDRIVNFAFAQANREAKVKGAEYGAANAPTLEQIRKSQEDGTPLSVPGDSNTTFGIAARAMALRGMRVSVESGAKKELSEIYVNALKTEIPLDKYAALADNVIKGYSSSLAVVSPSAANALKADLATSASLHYRTYAKNLAKKETRRKEAAVAIAMDQVVKEADLVVKSGNMWESEEGGVYGYSSTAALHARNRNKIMQLALSVGNKQMMESYLEKYSEKVQAAKIGALAEFAQDDDGTINVDRYRLLLSGKIDRFKGTYIAEMYNAMSDEDRASTLKEIARRGAEIFRLEESRDKREEEDRKRTVSKERINFLNALEKNDKTEMSNAITQLKKLRAANVVEIYTKAMEKGPEVSDRDTVVSLDGMLYENKLTRQKVVDAFKNKKVTAVKMKEYFGSIRAMNERKFKTYYDLYKSDLRVVENIFNPSQAEKDKREKVALYRADLLRERLLAEDEKRNPDYNKVYEKQKNADSKNFLSEGERTQLIDNLYSRLNRVQVLDAGEKEDAVKKAMNKLDNDAIKLLQSFLKKYLNKYKSSQRQEDTFAVERLKKLIDDTEKRVQDNAEKGRQN